MRTGFLALTVLTFLYLVGCTPSVTTFVMPEYQNVGPITGATLAIFPDVDIDAIDNATAIADDLGEGSAVDVYLNLLVDELPGRIQQHSHFHDVRMVDLKTDVTLVQDEFRLNEDKLTFLDVPEPGTTILFEDFEPDFVVFLQEIRTYEDRVKSTFTTTNAAGGVNQDYDRYLRFDFHYVLWDNIEGRLAVVGSGVAQDKVTLTMNENTWRKCFENMAKLIVHETPFQKVTRVY